MHKITDVVTEDSPLVSRPTSGAKTEQDDTAFSSEDRGILKYSENTRTDTPTGNSENTASNANDNISLSEECGKLQQSHRTGNDSEKLDSNRKVAPDR